MNKISHSQFLFRGAAIVVVVVASSSSSLFRSVL
jgi:hypothetical protein